MAMFVLKALRAREPGRAEGAEHARDAVGVRQVGAGVRQVGNRAVTTDHEAHLHATSERGVAREPPLVAGAVASAALLDDPSDLLPR